MKSKYVAGILALFFGIFGVHRFYLGKKGLGIAHFLLAMATIGITTASNGEAPLVLLPLVLGFIDSILFFAMPRVDFDEKYNNPGSKKQYRRDWQRQYEPAYASPPPPSYRDFKRSGIKNFREYRFEEAAEDFEDALDLSPGDPTLHFNLACTYSMLKAGEKAFDHLEKAVEYGFNKLDKIYQHDALAYLRALPQFDAFVSNGFRRPAAQLPSPEPNILEEPAKPGKASAGDILEQIAELGELKERGILTEEEFRIKKKKLLERS